MEIEVEHQEKFGCFSVPGRSRPMPYPAAVPGPVALRFSEEVCITLPLVRLVDHGRPLLLIGADVLACDDQGKQWEFSGIGPQKLQGSTHSQGWIRFQKGSQVAVIGLINAPIRGLKFNKHADEGPGVALAAQSKWQNEGLRGLLNPGSIGAVQHGSGKEPNSVQDILGQLAGAYGRPRCL